MGKWRDSKPSQMDSQRALLGEESGLESHGLGLPQLCYCVVASRVVTDCLLDPRSISFLL